MIKAGVAPDALALSPDGRLLYVADGVSDDSSAGGHTVTVISTSTDQARRSIDIGGAAWKIAISPDGKTLYALLVGGPDGQNSLVIADLATRRVAARIKFGYGAGDFIVAPDGREVYVLESGSRRSAEVVSLDPADGRQQGAPIPVPGDSEDLAISPRDGLLYVAGGEDGSRHSGEIEGISLADRVVRSRIETDDDVTELAVSADGEDLYAVGNDDSCPVDGSCVSGAHTLTIINAIDGQKTRRAGLQTGPVALAVARDGRTAYVLGAEGDIIPVSAVTGDPQRKFRAAGILSDPSSLDILVAPDGHAAYVAEANKGVAIVPLP